MIKKIRYYKTLSPTEMYIFIEKLSYILFGFSGKFENVDGKRRFSKDQKIISMDIENGFIDFEDTLKIHSKDPRKRRELPKNENDAKKLCNDFFIEKGELLKNDQILKKTFLIFLMIFILFRQFPFRIIFMKTHVLTIGNVILM